MAALFKLTKTIYDYINSAIEEGSQVDVIYTDFSKAFDKVNINILNKLKALGIDGPLLKWISSFVTNRTQIVKEIAFLKSSVSLRAFCKVHILDLFFLICLLTILKFLLKH